MSYCTRHVLKANLPNVYLPGHDKPEGVAIYAIPYRHGEVFAGRWLPDETIAEDDNATRASDSIYPPLKNPLKLLDQDGNVRDYNRPDGEIFKLEDGLMAMVFNHKPRPPAID